MLAGSTYCARLFPLPPSPVYSMPNIEHAMPAGAFVESCVSASARRSSVGGLDKSQDCGPPWSSEEAEEFGGWWGGRRGRWTKEHDEALVVVVAHTCGDEDGDADEQ